MKIRATCFGNESFWAGVVRAVFVCLAAFGNAGPGHAEPAAPRTLYIIPHTHADLSWVGTPRYCRKKNAQIIRQVLNIIRRDPDFRYTIETTAALEAFLEYYPHYKETIRDLLRRGIIDCGGLYAACAEALAGPEGLIRNVYFGKKWLADTFAYDTDFAWNIDIPGHTAQLPQILAKSGIYYVVTWRDYSGPWLSRWAAPDGSAVLRLELPGGYNNRQAYREPDVFFQRFERMRAHDQPLPLLAAAVGGDCRLPDPNIPARIRAYNRTKPASGISLRLVNSSEFFLQAEKQELPRCTGDIPSAWDAMDLYVPRYGWESRQVESLLLDGEKLAAITAALVAEYAYPANEIRDAWKGWLLNREHNWGGKGGRRSDAVKFRRARQLNQNLRQMIDTALQSLLRHIHKRHAGIPVAVFNPMNWERVDLATVSIPAAFPLREGQRWQIVDADGAILDSQQRRGSGGTVEVRFVARVPALGYATYYVRAVDAPNSTAVDATPCRRLENQFFQIEFQPERGAVSSIIDKQTGRQLLADYALDFSEVIAQAFRSKHILAPASMTGAWQRSSRYDTKTERVDCGPVSSTVRMTSAFVEGSALIREVTVYPQLKRIDVRIILSNWKKRAGAAKLRVGSVFALRTDSAAAVRYDIPYTVATYRGSAHTCAGQAVPRPAAHCRYGLFAKSWLDVASADSGCTVLSRWGYFDVNQAKEAMTVITAPLLITDQNFYGEPYFFDTAGTHVYEWSIRPYAGGFNRSAAVRAGWEQHSPLIAAAGTESARGFLLPETYSFCATQPESLIVTALKRAEDAQGIVLRCYEAAGRQTLGRIEFSPAHAGCFSADMLERPSRTALGFRTVTLPFAPGGIETLYLREKARD
ncbi:MAG: glycosyl hydrolase-related protein [Candidatus Omnitrophica bacterium]|nr:glycosyl hydrolase-related protein [Candidatus Omnitrophota bacterium]